ncbi:hypothetical protein [Pseudobacteriovorax antillogorgiicola]|nr:hypothetical protein [Pseudobacteriovorax antillogorgiicola]
MSAVNNSLSYNLTHEEQKNVLAKAFWALIDLYGFKQDVVARFLYLSPNNRQPLKEYREDLSFPSKPLVAMQNTAQLLGIHKNLGIIFPEVSNNLDNAKLKYSWFDAPMALYDGKSPLEFIKEGSEDEVLDRLKVVRRNLDIQRAGR